jgi:hypothetical protein
MLPAAETPQLGPDGGVSAARVIPAAVERPSAPIGPAAGPASGHTEPAQVEASAGPAGASEDAETLPSPAVGAAVVRAPRALRPTQPRLDAPAEQPSAPRMSPAPAVTPRGPLEGQAVDAPTGGRPAWSTVPEVPSAGVAPEAAHAEMPPATTAAEHAEHAVHAEHGKHTWHAEVPPATPPPWATAAPRPAQHEDRNPPPVARQPAAPPPDPPLAIARAHHRGLTDQRRARLSIGRVEIQVTNQPPPVAPPTPAPAPHDTLPQRLERQFLDRFSLLP